MIQCINCGEFNPEDNQFCSRCGNPLINNMNVNGNRQPENNQQPNNQQIPNQQIPNQQIPNNQQPYNQQIPNNQQPYNQQIPNNQRIPNNQNYNNPNQNQSAMEKLGNLSDLQKGLLVIAVCCLGVLILAAIMGTTYDNGSLPYNSSYGSSDSDYNYTNSSLANAYNNLTKDNCEEVSYKELNKNPSKYEGESIKLRGKVMQIYEGGSYDNYLLLDVDGDISQIAYVEYVNDTNIVEDDWITVYGICGGSYTYTTKIGGSNTVPSVYAKYLEKSS